MNDPVLLVTRHEQDLAWVPELHKAGFSIYVYSKTSESTMDDLWDFVLRTKPKLLLIDDDYNEHILDLALKVYQSELTQNIWIFFLAKRSSVMPPYGEKLQRGHGKYRWHTRPYGITEHGETEIGYAIRYWMERQL